MRIATKPKNCLGGGYSWILTIPVSAFTAFAVFFMALSTVSLGNNKVYADVSSDTKVNLDVGSVINISAPTTATINCASANQLCTTSSTINVSTNNVTGYTLQMNATNGSSTSLTNTAITPNVTIPTLSQAYSSANFPVNYWGYTGGTNKSSESGGYNCASNYCPILAYSSGGSYAPNHVIKETSTPSTSSSVTITFGAKTSATKEAGTYSTSVTLTAVANAIPAPPMQDFDSSACATATTDQTITLRDTRDDTEYTVAKLQDGNCWMTQNLELGQYGQTINLTSDTSNVSSSGYTLTLPSANNSVYKGNSNHYGNYYNWNTATAGSGTSTVGENAPYDICPKNWRLPSVSSTGATDSEFYLMLNHYLDSSKWGGSSWSGITTTQFTNPPVSLVFSGGLNSSGLLYGQGSFGNSWSSTSNGSSNAFYLNVNTSGNVNPRYYFDRSCSYSVRCLVPGS